jgi:hypothetical protein
MHRISPNQVINELSVGKYDVQVTMGASHATQRQENTELMISLLQTMPNMADMIAPILIKNVDNPAAQEITKLLEERKNIQPAPDPLLELSNKQLEMSEARKMKELELKAFREAKNLELKERIENQRLELDELKAIVEVLKSNLTTQQLNKAEQDLNLN